MIMNFSHAFGQKLNAEPTIFYPLPLTVSIPDSEKVLTVVHIPRSEFAPHFPAAKEDRIFWKRTNKGCDQMSLQEIRAMFLNYEERRARLKQLVAELDYNFQLLDASPYMRGEPNLDVFETSTIDTILV